MFGRELITLKDFFKSLMIGNSTFLLSGIFNLIKQS